MRWALLLTFLAVIQAQDTCGHLALWNRKRVTHGDMVHLNDHSCRIPWNIFELRPVSLWKGRNSNKQGPLIL